MSLYEVAKAAKKPAESIIAQDVARERLRRALMAQRARSKYKFRDPEGIASKYAAPSALDQGQRVTRPAIEARRQVFKVGKD